MESSKLMHSADDYYNFEIRKSSYDLWCANNETRHIELNVFELILSSFDVKSKIIQKDRTHSATTCPQLTTNYKTSLLTLQFNENLKMPLFGATHVQ